MILNTAQLTFWMTSGPGGAFAPRPRRAESAAGARRAAAEAAAGEEGDPGRRRGDAGVWRIFFSSV